MEVLNGTNGTNVTSEIWGLNRHAPYVENWPLMTSPGPILAILLSYLLVVLKLGPWVMQKRAPMTLNNLLIVYNAVQVLVSAYLFNVGYQILRSNGLVHTTCLLNNEHVMSAITTGIYSYLLAKISELLDTVFFILRKKHNQLTFLHVYHHTSMVLFTWISLKYEPTHSVVFLGTINSFIHIMMYAYYGLAAFPALTKYLWWKKYITSMQLIQFVLIILHSLFDYVYGACPPSYLLLSLIVCNAAFFVFLFGDFYIKSYTKEAPSKTVKQKVK